MVTKNKIILDKLKQDLNILHSKIGHYLINVSRLSGNDEELKRLWKLYEIYRTDLVELDEDLFGSLRKIDQPQPDKSNVYLKEGFFSHQKDLMPLSDEVYKALQYFNIYENKNKDANSKSDPIKNIRLITKRFVKVSRQLLDRYNGRDTLKIEDEYDTQDLFHSLLKLFFDDIRPEEWIPSYAGGSNRMDFLLKNENIVIEIKKTRKGLDAKTIGEQLIIDITKYQAHPDCKVLYCFVYDPEIRIANPAGIENDLSKPNGKLNVIVDIEPK